MSTSPINIVLVDDHQIVREGFKLMLLQEEDFEISGEAASGGELFKLLREQTPHIIVLDIALPGMNGIDICKRIKQEYGQVKVLFLTANVDAVHLKQAVKVGADGFLPKDASSGEFTEALKSIRKGVPYFSQKMSGLMARIMSNSLNSTNKETELTLREIEIIRKIAEGKVQKEIAAELNISPRTVETHKKNIQQKLGINNTVDLVKYAIRERFTSL